MKKTMIALAMGAALVVGAMPAAFAQDANTGADSSSPFIRLQLGRAHLNHGVYKDNKLGTQLLGGYDWSLGNNFQLGVEAGYAYMTRFAPRGSYGGTDVFSRARSRGWLAGVNGRYFVNSNWYLNGDAGAYFATLRGPTLAGDVAGGAVPVAGPETANYTTHKTGWYAGGGAGYQFDNGVSLGLNYDYYRAKKHDLNLSTGVIGVEVGYHF